MKQKIALVLSSGGSKGIAHIGAIKQFEKHGFEISSITGSSIGAVIGGLFAMGKLNLYEKWVTTLDRRSILSLMDFEQESHGLLKGEKVFEHMKLFIPDFEIEHMQIPFRAVATDLVNNHQVVFDKGSFYAAARASISSPALFLPAHNQNRFLIDGSILNPIPIDCAVRTEGDLLAVINLYDTSQQKPAGAVKNSSVVNSNPEPKNEGRLPFGRSNASYNAFILASFTAMEQRLAELIVDKDSPDITVNIPGESKNIFEFYKAAELIQIGEKAANEAITSFLKE